MFGSDLLGPSPIRRTIERRPTSTPIISTSEYFLFVMPLPFLRSAAAEMRCFADEKIPVCTAENHICFCAVLGVKVSRAMSKISKITPALGILMLVVRIA